MECPQYQIQRRSLFENLACITKFSEMKDSDKFKLIMSYNYGDTDVCKTVTNFIYQIWEIRKASK